MKIAVLGLGNVGLVAAICLAEQGHEIIGVEISKQKIQLLNQGVLYIEETNLQKLFTKNRENITFTTELNSDTKVDCYIVCVGTPASHNGKVYLGQIKTTFENLVETFDKDDNSFIILRSTIPPGTIESVVKPLVKNKKIIYHPEFLREGSAVEDFMFPHLHVVGLENESDYQLVQPLLANCNNIKYTSYRAAEMLKYLNNSFHALKVSYVNEIASIASAYDVDVNELVDCFLADTKLNISTKYFRPGFSFGGPCLTKDVSALINLAQNKQVNVPLITSILASNEKHLFRVFSLIEKLNPSSILIFGVSFKEGSNDLRNSPVLDLINLIQKTPSYIPRKDIFVKDYEINESIANTNKIMCDGAITVEVDLVILGPLKLNNLDLKYIESHKGPILDLGYIEHGINDRKIIKAYESDL
jgi:GDP-mannose 6-dehydrogenase